MTQHRDPKITKIKETCLYMDDLKKAESFYHGILGLPIVSQEEDRFVFFKAGGSMLLCFNPALSKVQNNLPRHFSTGEYHFAFECEEDDYPVWKEKIEAAGIGIEEEVDWPSGGKSFYFRDPKRNCVEIVMPGIWGD
jgi:catechol-2,3-dioxygenase